MLRRYLPISLYLKFKKKTTTSFFAIIDQQRWKNKKVGTGWYRSLQVGTELEEGTVLFYSPDDFWFPEVRAHHSTKPRKEHLVDWKVRYGTYLPTDVTNKGTNGAISHYRFDEDIV